MAVWQKKEIQRDESFHRIQNLGLKLIFRLLKR